MADKAPILYSGFYDRPLAFVVSYAGIQYLFWRVFDDLLDDYPNAYKVFVLPELTADEIMRSWQKLPELALRYLGEVRVSQIEFDPSYRKGIDTRVLETLRHRDWWR
jgi:hypothetical protein